MNNKEKQNVITACKTNAEAPFYKMQEVTAEARAAFQEIGVNTLKSGNDAIDRITANANQRFDELKDWISSGCEGPSPSERREMALAVPKAPQTCKLS